MKITDIRIRRVVTEGPMKGFVSLVFDDSFAVHDIKIIAAREKTFVVMPAVKNSYGQSRDIAHPVNREFRTYIEESILAAYEAVVRADEAAAGTLGEIEPPTVDSF